MMNKDSSISDSLSRSSGDAMAHSETTDEDDMLDRRGGLGNGLMSVGSSTGEYISAGGVSMLDISTRLRITEAELAIVRREVSELLAEKNTLAMQCRQHEESWKFALHQLGRAIEQRDEALAQIQTANMIVIRERNKSPEMKLKKMKPQVLRSELESCLQQLDTQTRVARQLEYERDRANDDSDFAKAQLNTVMIQYQDLLSACTEVERLRDKAISEAHMLKEELNRYDSDLHNALEIELGEEEGEEGEGSNREKILLQQIRLLREEKEHLQHTYQQTLEQYKHQLTKSNMDRRHTVASLDSMRALVQRRLESAQTENSELRSELRASGEVINQLKDQLAQVRIATHQHGNGYAGDLSHDDTPPESQTSQNLIRPSSGNIRNIPPLSQDSGISLYSNEGGYTHPITGSLSQNTELITPGNNLSGYRVFSARTRRLYVPTASPFPEESHDNSSSEEGASWI